MRDFKAEFGAEEGGGAPDILSQPSLFRCSGRRGTAQNENYRQTGTDSGPGESSEREEGSCR